MSKKSKSRDGEWIEISWEYGDPEFIAVRGHVDLATFVSVAEKHDDDGNPDVYQQPRHAYARWSMHGSESAEEGMRFIELRDGPGRGRFKVTVADRRLSPELPLPTPEIGERARIAGEKEWGTIKRITGGSGHMKWSPLIHLDMDNWQTPMPASLTELRTGPLPTWREIGAE